MAVAAPALISILRLGVAAGGELETTLLLVANVNPINLVAAFVTNSTRTVSALLIVLFAIGATVDASAGARAGNRARDSRPLVARWAGVAPLWFQILMIVVALATWQIVYLPLLFLAVVAMFQLPLYEVLRARGRLLVPLLLGIYVTLLLPTLVAAVTQRATLVIVLLVVPAVLALAITGPVHPTAVRPLATLGPLIMGVALSWTAYSVVTTPILPLTVTTVVADAGQRDAQQRDAQQRPESGAGRQPPPGPAPAPTDLGPARASAASTTVPAPPVTPSPTPAMQEIRGHVIQVDDIHAAILQEQGGVRYVPVDDIRSRVLCPREDDLPRYRLHVYGFHVEDSILQGLGRRERPTTPTDPACRATS